MKNFNKLTGEVYDEIWDRFYNYFDFSPGTANFPAITTNIKPQLKYDINKFFQPFYLTGQVESFALDLFTSVSRQGDRLYALDWQHECYDFDPRLEMDRNEFNEWIIPVLPNGDYYIFLTKDFKEMWFGHPWEQTVTLVGENIVRRARTSYLNPFN